MLLVSFQKIPLNSPLQKKGGGAVGMLELIEMLLLVEGKGTQNHKKRAG